MRLLTRNDLVVFQTVPNGGMDGSLSARVRS